LFSKKHFTGTHLAMVLYHGLMFHGCDPDLLSSGRARGSHGFFTTPTWWFFFRVGKWLIALVISGLTLLSPRTTRVITYLRFVG